MKKAALLYLIPILSCLGLTGQNPTYGEVYGYCYIYSNYEPADTIVCGTFFDEWLEMEPACLFDMEECCPPFPLNRAEMAERFCYPGQAAKYRISGYAIVRFLIGYKGELLCYRIDTDLGEVFIREIEAHITDYEFEAWTCKGKPHPYYTFVPVRFDFAPADKPGKRTKRKK